MRKLVYAEVTARFDRQRNTGRRFFNVVFAQLLSLLIARVYATPTKRYVIVKGLSASFPANRDSLAAAFKSAQGWDFAVALHHALSDGCDDFVTLDADLVKRSARSAADTAKVAPAIFKL